MAKLICDKNGIILRKNKKENTFIIEMEIKNPNVKISDKLSVDLYEVMAKLNEKYIEKMELVKKEENRLEFLLLLKAVAKDMGVAPKYMYFEMLVEKPNENTINYKTRSIPYSGEISDKYELAYSEYGFMSVEAYNEHHVKLFYEVHMDLEDEIPIYMENVVGIMIKKMFFNLKSYIENSQ